MEIAPNHNERILKLSVLRNKMYLFLRIQSVKSPVSE